jgi:hypothetical protein
MTTAVPHTLSLGSVQLTLSEPAEMQAQQQWQKRLRDAFDRVTLYPSIPPQAILVVRHLDDPHPGGLLSDIFWQGVHEWEQKAQTQINDCWRTAIRAAYDPVPPSANAVWFADQAEWLACLSWDLHQGIAHERWWWQSWLRHRSYDSAGDRLFQLWKDDIQWLPQMLTLVEQQHGSGVQSVLAYFDSFQAECLSQWVAQVYRLPDESTSQVIIHDLKRSLPKSTQRITQDLPESLQTLSVLCFVIASDPLAIQHYRQRQWSATEANEPPAGVELPVRAEDSPDPDNAPGISQRDFSEELGASTLSDVSSTSNPPRIPRIVSIQSQPLGKDSQTLDQAEAISSSLARPSNPIYPETNLSTGIGQAESISSALAQPSNPIYPETNLSTGIGQAESISSSLAHLPIPSHPEANSLTDFGTPDQLGTTPEPSEAFLVQSNRSPALTTPAEQGVTTAIGGLWYLVNVLIDLDWFSQTVPLNPWHQLLGLGQAILGDHPPDRVWNLLLDAAEEPIETTQLDDWLQVALPVVLTHLTERLDSIDDMADIKTILLEPATLYVTRTHIDVLFSLEQIRLDVRMAGLDRDPGWVPELARVIAFHYE